MQFESCCPECHGTKSIDYRDGDYETEHVCDRCGANYTVSMRIYVSTNPVVKPVATYNFKIFSLVVLGKEITFTDPLIVVINHYSHPKDVFVCDINDDSRDLHIFAECDNLDNMRNLVYDELESYVISAWMTTDTDGESAMEARRTRLNSFYTSKIVAPSYCEYIVWDLSETTIYMITKYREIADSYMKTLKSKGINPILRTSRTFPARQATASDAILEIPNFHWD